MDKLVAVFATPRKMIDYAIDTQNKRASVNYAYDVSEHRGITRVTGKSHEIMYLIGEIAANGEASLYTVQPLHI